jgi:4-oxalocrotonate tautomerase
MPHVEIKCFPGRSDEQKKKCADKIAEDIADILGCKISSVSVVIKDIPEEEWKEKVWDVDIVPNEKYLYRKPSYTCERLSGLK